jgi:hypothetical protein
MGWHGDNPRLKYISITTEGGTKGGTINGERKDDM